MLELVALRRERFRNIGTSVGNDLGNDGRSGGSIRCSGTSVNSGACGSAMRVRTVRDCIEGISPARDGGRSVVLMTDIVDGHF